MHCSVNLSGNTSFVLQDELLIYRASSMQASSNRGSAFVVRRGMYPTEGSTPIPGPARPITESFLRELCRQLRENTETEILPASVLAYGDGSIAWWRPAGNATLFFSEGTVASHLNAKSVPLPPLVFVVKQQQMSVAALREDKRPDAGTKLYRAPFWNVYDNCSLCHGSMKNPGGALAKNISEWEEAFFGSAFTHPNYHEKAIAHKNGMVGAWEEAIAKGSFLSRWLVPIDKTLSSLVRGAE